MALITTLPLKFMVSAIYQQKLKLNLLLSALLNSDQLMTWGCSCEKNKIQTSENFLTLPKITTEQVIIYYQQHESCLKTVRMSQWYLSTAPLYFILPKFEYAYFDVIYG